MRLLCLLLLPACGAAPLRLGVAEYRDKVYASWLGQCAGNIYGLAHEQRYFREPGPDRFPLGYSGWGAARMKELNGAFSDDDTDVEYMYLLAMEKHGIEPTYAQLAEFWKRHVHRDVWLANRAAVAAMRHGIAPPYSGMQAYNPHWFQIDPQLVNEIWAVTAPGMVRYSVAKSEWAARIMSDGWAVEPTMFYAAMYAAAFFESDIPKLIAVGKAALPAGSRFAVTIDRMVELHRKHPDDWKAARLESLPLLYLQEPETTRTGTNANLNAALAVLALLYGRGDFQRTLDLTCALGFDADNQAATLSGLLGIVGGTRGIPHDLLFPYPELGWKEPLNDRYKNVTREELPDAGLKDIAARLANQGEQVILRHGGRRNGDFYEVDSNALFHAPFEFPTGPLPVIEIGKPVAHDFIATAGAKWKLVEGKLPRGIAFANGRLSGIAAGPAGVYPVTIAVGALRRSVTLVVRPENLARSARRILTPIEKPDLAEAKKLFLDTPIVRFADSPEVLRDAKRGGDGATFLSLGADTEPRIDHYGYEWDQRRQIGLVALTTGFIEESSGWFTDLGVEFRDETGTWKPVRGLRSVPPFPMGNEPATKAHFAEYLLLFDPVETRAIRVAGNAGAARGPRFTSVSELSVYAPLPGAQRLN